MSNEITQSFGKQLTWCMTYCKHSNVHFVLVTTKRPYLSRPLVARGINLPQLSSNRKGSLLAHTNESRAGLLWGMAVSGHLSWRYWDSVRFQLFTLFCIMLDQFPGSSRFTPYGRITPSEKNPVLSNKNTRIDWYTLLWSWACPLTSHLSQGTGMHWLVGPDGSTHLCNLVRVSFRYWAMSGLYRQA